MFVATTIVVDTYIRRYQLSHKNGFQANDAFDQNCQNFEEASFDKKTTALVMPNVILPRVSAS